MRHPSLQRPPVIDDGICQFIRTLIWPSNDSPHAILHRTTLSVAAPEVRMEANKFSVNHLAQALCYSAVAMSLALTLDPLLTLWFGYGCAVYAVALTLCLTTWKATLVNALCSAAWLLYAYVMPAYGGPLQTEHITAFVIYASISATLVFSGARAARALNASATREHCLRMALQAADRTNEALLCASRQKDEFLSVVSHELRNPLSAVSNAAEIIRMRSYKRDVQPPAELLHRQLGHMKRLLDDLLDLAHINRGSIKLERSIQDVRLCVQGALDANVHHIESAQQSVEVALPPHPIEAHIDGARIVQIVSNLLNNATKYAGAGAHITITLAKVTNAIELTVSDNGKGVDTNLLPHLFNRDPVDRKQSSQGLGLGLWLSRELACKHGGDLTAASEGVGKGIAFTLSLPAKPAPSSASAPDNGIGIHRSARVLQA